MELRLPGGVYRLEEVTSEDAAALAAIGGLRVAVWQQEGTLAASLAAAGVWLDAFDPKSRHWVVRDESGALVACARLSAHERMEDSPDGAIWTQARRPLPAPTGNIAKLVVARAARGMGIASTLNDVRIDAARAMGLRSLTVTASADNARLLQRAGFVDTGMTIQFENRPGVTFHAMEKRL